MRRVVAVLAVPGVLAVGIALRPDRHEHRRLPALVEAAPDAIRHLEVEAGGRRAGLVRDTGQWSAEPGTPPGSAPLLGSVERQLFPLVAYRALQADPADPQYGLADPAAVVRIEAGELGRIAVRLGAASFSGAGFYAQAEGRPGRVYLVPRSTVDLLRSLTTGERTSSADPLAHRAGEYEAERNEAQDAKEIPVYLRQVLDRGGAVPPPGP
jgi:hypothetical protein